MRESSSPGKHVFQPISYHRHSREEKKANKETLVWALQQEGVPVQHESNINSSIEVFNMGRWVTLNIYCNPEGMTVKSDLVKSYARFKTRDKEYTTAEIVSRLVRVADAAANLLNQQDETARRKKEEREVRREILIYWSSLFTAISEKVVELFGRELEPYEMHTTGQDRVRVRLLGLESDVEFSFSFDGQGIFTRVLPGMHKVLLDYPYKEEQSSFLGYADFLMRVSNFADYCRDLVISKRSNKDLENLIEKWNTLEQKYSN